MQWANQEEWAGAMGPHLLLVSVVVTMSLIMIARNEEDINYCQDFKNEYACWASLM